MSPTDGLTISPSSRGGSVAIGNFDGVHRGHRAMLDVLTADARRDGHAAVVVTFEPHPLAILRPEVAPVSLTTPVQRVELLRAAGADDVIVLPTTRELLRLTATEFFERIILQELHAKRLVEGPNFFFGRDRAGNITVLRQLCQAHGIALDVIAPVTIDGQWVSSSVIRSLLVDGDVDDAVALLGHPYRLTGRVVTGVQRGRQLGFPTANLEGFATVVPGLGVYAGRCAVDGQTYAAAIHLGPNPTFAEERTKVEVHLLDFAGDLYGRVLDVDFLARVRPVQKFASVDALRAQLERDVASVRKLAAAVG
jgi:riboflavin kinase/FMN adenylyltransferase